MKQIEKHNLILKKYLDLVDSKIIYDERDRVFQENLRFRGRKPKGIENKKKSKTITELRKELK